jgi:hypothetical protein
MAEGLQIGIKHFPALEVTSSIGVLRTSRVSMHQMHTQGDRVCNWTVRRFRLTDTNTIFDPQLVQVGIREVYDARSSDRDHPRTACDRAPLAWSQA